MAAGILKVPSNFCLQLPVSISLSSLVRKYHLKSWPNCFIANELANWLVASKNVKDMEEAVELGEALVDDLLIVHVNRDHTFKNEMLFFRFFEDERDYGHVRKTKDA